MSESGSDAREMMEKRFLEETKVLLDMEDEEREKYVVDVLEWFLSRLKWIGSAGGKIKQFKRLGMFRKELAEGKGEVLLVCALWTVKPEFRWVWGKVIAELLGIEKEVAW